MKIGHFILLTLFVISPLMVGAESLSLSKGKTVTLSNESFPKNRRVYRPIYYISPQNEALSSQDPNILKSEPQQIEPLGTSLALIQEENIPTCAPLWNQEDSSHITSPTPKKRHLKRYRRRR